MTYQFLYTTILSQTNSHVFLDSHLPFSLLPFLPSPQTNQSNMWKSEWDYDFLLSEPSDDILSYLELTLKTTLIYRTLHGPAPASLSNHTSCHSCSFLQHHSCTGILDAPWIHLLPQCLYTSCLRSQMFFPHMSVFFTHSCSICLLFFSFRCLVFFYWHTNCLKDNSEHNYKLITHADTHI